MSENYVHPEVLVTADWAEQHLDDVHAYLVYLTGERSLAEDLTSATFERAFHSWRRYDPRRASAKTCGKSRRSPSIIARLFWPGDIAER